MPTPLCREDLDHHPCYKCGKASKALSITGKCHPDHPVITDYTQGCLVISCSVCHQLIVAVQVAGQAPRPRIRNTVA